MAALCSHAPLGAFTSCVFAYPPQGCYLARGLVAAYEKVARDKGASFPQTPTQQSAAVTAPTQSSRRSVNDEDSFASWLFFAATGLVLWKVFRFDLPAAILGGFAGMVLGNILVLGPLTARRERIRFEQLLCPHGMPGGLTRSLCAECQVEACVRKREEERRRAAEELRNRIARQADTLEREERRRLNTLLLLRLDGLLSLSPRAFEDAIADLFRKDGYHVVQTPYVNDHGLDAIATKDGRTFLIECKRYDKQRAVGRRDLQVFYSAIVEARADRGFFVTTARCKRTALDFVKGKPIELIDGDKLVARMQGAYAQQSSNTTYKAMCRECGAVALRDVLRPSASAYCANGHAVPANISFDSLRPSDTKVKDQLCPVCGAVMKVVKGRRGRFWGCTEYPRCRGTTPYGSRRSTFA